MMNKKEKEKTSKENFQSPWTFSPFTNLRKSFRRLKQKKIKRALSADSIQNEVPMNKVKPNDVNIQKESTNSNKSVIFRESSRNEPKKTSVKKNSSLHDTEITEKPIIENNRLSVIEWSSCESITETEKTKCRKHDSLRRSRASLVIPSDTEVSKTFISPNRLNYYRTLQQIKESKNTDGDFNCNSAQNLTIQHNKTINETVLCKCQTAPKRKCVSIKHVGHSLSLPNICEDNREEFSEIEISIDDLVSKNLSLSHNQIKQNVRTNYQIPCSSKQLDTVINKAGCLAEVENEVAANKTNNSFRLANKCLYYSSPALDRPPLPSVPKPINRRNRILRWASTEGINRNRECKFNKEKLTRTLSELTSAPTSEEIVNLISKLSKVNTLFAQKSGLERRMIENGSGSIIIEHQENMWKKKLFNNYKLHISVAESLWDHTGLNEDDLSFSSGDVVTVFFKEDANWWWGTHNGHEGWFPASYVRLRVVQEIDNEVEVGDDVISNIALNNPNGFAKKNSKETLMTLRAKCVEELLNTERDYVKLLKNIIEGYLHKFREETHMFTEDDCNVIFGNIEELYELHKDILRELQAAIQLDQMERSSVGDIFTKKKCRFEVYSKYCNNQPRSVARLSCLSKEKKYKMLFEACRLRQNMIRLSLDSFLLSPVQKICKYPLQLKELIKHTETDHPDYNSLINARNCMQSVASLINERKRRFENVNKLARWQLTITNWKGDDVVTKSSDLLHKDVLNKITNTKDVERVVYLFDHQLIYFRKDDSKRLPLSYCGRLDLDSAIVENITDDAFTIGGEPFHNGWKIWNCDKNKWCYFYTTCKQKKADWLKAFEEERKHVGEEINKGFTVSPEVRAAAMESANAKHIEDLRKSRMRRKSIATTHANLVTTNSSPAKPKYDSLLSAAEEVRPEAAVVKRTNKPRRPRSLRLSLQGSLFDKL